MPIHNTFCTDPKTGLPSPAGNRELGPLIAVEVHVPDSIAKVLSDDNKPIPSPKSGMALIDTGANITCVHEPILQELTLNPISVIQCGTASGRVEQNVYPVKLEFPAQGFSVSLSGAAGVDLTGQTAPLNPPQDIIALLGRNFLERCIFIWNGPGGTWSLAM